ncbi:hypothetical protein [Nostoc sp. 'Peltigera malacea cyanobiont' DB3992]|uniref:hypothetical protein n=1 Tax=Nostoc sp. 'Peltigera malacea cyanobiont' DB3992 TaxID=1206980 RepID=UPI00211DFA1F|nr:hypothetical protein [Nostoc sp. 'Peltigera malacea cyanobiont' DB3992]
MSNGDLFFCRSNPINLPGAVHKALPMFSPIFSCALVQSVVAMSTTGYAYAVATAVSVTVTINSLQIEFM